MRADGVIEYGQEDSLEPADQDRELLGPQLPAMFFTGDKENEYAVHLELGLSPMMARSHLVEFE
ncbi:hypothetical protein V1525DRAFT_387016 [Lipomyces kononenkoae]|uniref:Uncharacterized protein n=1 Tax=Lipomyces kononenkoae TaxID=34357 RepID=A0ACC3T5N9_LIPKO